MTNPIGPAEGEALRRLIEQLEKDAQAELDEAANWRLHVHIADTVAAESAKRSEAHHRTLALVYHNIVRQLKALAPLSGPVDASGEPDFWRCKTCGCLWQDNHDGTVSLGSTRQSCCETCDREPSHIACEPLFRAAAADIRREMHAYLDTLTIHGDNIGAIRGSLLMPFDSQWNGWVRDDTAAREVSAPALKSAAAAVPSSPAQPTQSWAVTVERNGESVVTLSSNMLAGRDLSDEDERVIRMAGEHLLSFIGAVPSSPAQKEKS